MFLFLSIPIIIKLSITVYVDLGLIFFSTAALLSILKWIETEFKLNYLLLAGSCCGLAMGTKYNGLIVFFLLTMFVPFIYSRLNNEHPKVKIKAISAGLIFCSIALAIFSPWMIRNYIWTRNPVYPLYNSLFNVQMNPPCPIRWEGVEFNEPVQEKIRFGRFAYRKFMYGEKWWETASLPIRIFLQGKDNDFQFYDGRLSALLLILPLFAFATSKNDRKDSYRSEKYIFLVFSVLFILFTMFSNVVRIRYIAPALPSLVILSVYGLKNLIAWLNNCPFNFIRRSGSIVVLFSIALYMIWMNGGYLVDQFKYVKPFSYISGAISRDVYVSRFRHEYAAFQYVNEHLPLDSKILFFYIGKRGYYCDRQYFPDEGGNMKFLYRLIRSHNSALKINQALQAKGITHLLINNSLFKERLYSDLKNEKRDLFLNFIINYCEILFDGDGFSVYKLQLNIRD